MAKRVILLTNLGSPDSTSVPDVRRYLNEFLMDERVIDIPKWLRYVIVKGFIVPFRAPKSAKNYEKVWTENGSPLLHISKEQQRLVAEASGVPTYLCMRYQNPTPQVVMQQIVNDNPDLQEVALVPMYPHYAMSSYETAVEYIKEVKKGMGLSFDLTIVAPFYKEQSYIQALSENVKPYVLNANSYDHILFSYHGIPERHVKKTDVTRSHCLQMENCCSVDSEAHKYCYRHQIITTTELVAKTLGIPQGKYSFSFQSRLGTDEWLKPYTAVQLKEFPKQGIKSLIVVCPAFVADCLETLEEMHGEGKEIFEEAGGTEFTVLPCLNTDPNWIDSIVHLAKQAE